MFSNQSEKQQVDQITERIDKQRGKYHESIRKGKTVQKIRKSRFYFIKSQKPEIIALNSIDINECLMRVIEEKGSFDNMNFVNGLYNYAKSSESQRLFELLEQQKVAKLFQIIQETKELKQEIEMKLLWVLTLLADYIYQQQFCQRLIACFIKLIKEKRAPLQILIFNLLEYLSTNPVISLIMFDNQFFSQIETHCLNESLNQLFLSLQVIFEGTSVYNSNIHCILNMLLNKSNMPQLKQTVLNAGISILNQNLIQNENMIKQNQKIFQEAINYLLLQENIIKYIANNDYIIFQKLELLFQQQYEDEQVIQFVENVFIKYLIPTVKNITQSQSILQQRVLKILLKSSKNNHLITIITSSRPIIDILNAFTNSEQYQIRTLSIKALSNLIQYGQQQQIAPISICILDSFTNFLSSSKQNQIQTTLIILSSLSKLFQIGQQRQFQLQQTHNYYFYRFSCSGGQTFLKQLSQTHTNKNIVKTVHSLMDKYSTNE